MPERQSSSTAVGVAVLRAAHRIIDGTPYILDDTVIAELLGASAIAAMSANHERLQSSGARALRAHVLLRSRFAEDRLELAVKRGLRQYIILGAGLDTFAYRQPQWARDVEVIEVDHPSTQSAKRKSLSSAGIAVPDNVRFAAIDFETVSLRDGLVANGVDMARPTFFSWLGVTMYLTEDAVDAVLATVASFPPQSEIVFTFAQPRSPDEGISPLAEKAASVGEPWLTYFEPQRLEQKLRAAGFGDVYFLTPARAERDYFRSRKDGLQPPRRVSIVDATVTAHRRRDMEKVFEPEPGAT